MTNEKINILLIDKDEMMAEAMSRILARHGYSVKTCDNYTAFINAKENFTPDVIILDGDISDENIGFILNDKENNNPLVKLLVISGSDDEIKILSSGADEWLHKPCKIPVLLMRLELLCR